MGIYIYIFIYLYGSVLAEMALPLHAPYIYICIYIYLYVYIYIYIYIFIWVGLSRNGLAASWDKWQIWDGKRKTCFSLSRIVTFLQKKLYQRAQKVTFFGKEVIKNVTSSKKYFRMRERHILPRNVTKVTRHIFWTPKKSDKCDVTHPNLRREPGTRFG